MQYRTLGHSGTAVSTIALGTMDFGSMTAEKDAHAILDAFVEAGGNLVDTANVYNAAWSRRSSAAGSPAARPTSPAGSSWPPRAGTRRHRTSTRRVPPAAASAAPLTGRCAASAWTSRPVPAARLDPLTPVEETLTFLDGAVRSGKVSYIGLSNFTGWQLQLMMSTAAHGGRAGPGHPPAAVQPAVPGERMGSRPRRAAQQHRYPALVAAGRRVPLRQVRTGRRARRTPAPGRTTRSTSGYPRSTPTPTATGRPSTPSSASRGRPGPPRCRSRCAGSSDQPGGHRAGHRGAQRRAAQGQPRRRRPPARRRRPPGPDRGERPGARRLPVRRVRDRPAIPNPERDDPAAPRQRRPHRPRLTTRT